MALVNAISGTSGAFQDLEMNGEIVSSAAAPYPILSMPISGTSGLYLVEITLAGYAVSGYAITGLLSASVGAGVALAAGGGAFVAEITPHLPVMIRLSGGRTAVVIAVADPNNATLSTAWTGAPAVGVADGKVHVRTLQTYRAVLQVSDIDTGLVLIGAPVTADPLKDAGGLYVDYGTGTPIITVGVHTGAAYTTSGVANTANTQWHASLKVRALLPTFV